MPATVVTGTDLTCSTGGGVNPGAACARSTPTNWLATNTAGRKSASARADRDRATRTSRAGYQGRWYGDGRATAALQGVTRKMVNGQRRDAAESGTAPW